MELMKCPICGKTFIPAPQHIYRMKPTQASPYGRPICSYTCYRKWQKDLEAKSVKKRQAAVKSREAKRLSKLLNRDTDTDKESKPQLE